LKVATIFSFGANDEDGDGMIDENPEDVSGLDKKFSRFFGRCYC